ncbi:MAG: glycosyltransferase family 39 protein [Anaerolineae bacterium]|nr:glycosyltransferase family 39 protein [Anaerolineae bacterium]
MNSAQRLVTLARVLIVAAYVAVAAQYARLTPPWQAPDEPAHYNYVRHVAERGELPILQPGDYPHDYLEEIKASRFPPHMSIDSIRYESWQPPLYYLPAAGVYRLAQGWSLEGRLFALRLISVLYGALLIVVAGRIADSLAPGQPWLALGTMALVATVPMHTAMTAAVNNDTLAELWVALILWQLLARLQAPDGLRAWLGLGATLGLAALTKTSTWIVLPLVVGVVCYVTWRDRLGRGRLLLCRGLAVALPALALLLPWLARNVSVYGIGDPLAFSRHSAVVVGQLRTADWLADVGLRRGLADLLKTTFQSFWGQFGWMGVPIDLRLYRGLAIATGLSLLGLALRVPRDWRRLGRDERARRLLLVGSTALTGASFLWYNLSFVQHQGRYLFPALIPIALCLVAGWREITQQSRRTLFVGVLCGAAVALGGASLIRGQAQDKRTLAGLLGFAALSGLVPPAPGLGADWLYALPYPLLIALDLLCLYGYVLPCLRP